MSSWTDGVVAAEDLLKGVHGEVAKALDPLDPADFDVLVARLGRSFQAATSRIEASTIRSALEAADVDWPELSEAQRDRSFAAIKSALGQGVGRMIPAATAVLAGRRGSIFGAARRGVAARLPSRFTLSPHMALRDREAERLVRANASNFIRDELGRRRDDLSEMARVIVARGLEDGLGRAEIADDLATAMSGRVVRSTDYWNVVSGAYVNRARSYSQLLSYEDAGIATYTFDAVLDEVTTEICRFMHGHTFSVPRARTTMDSTLALNDPDEIASTEPWARVGRLPDGSRQLYYNQGDRRVRIADIQSSAMGTRDERGTFSNAMTPAQLEAAGLQYPPLHGHCRSTIIADI